MTAALSASQPCLPAPHLLDPWWDVYLPATLGERDLVLRLLQPMPENRDLLAIGARALEVLGMNIEARRFATRAIQKGGMEALSLATFMAPDGETIARLRMAAEHTPGRQADAACDRAILSLRRGNLQTALNCIKEAQSICPDHLETAHWWRFFEESTNPLEAFRRQRFSAKQVHVPEGHDMMELLPTRQTGWLSPERFHRRVLGLPERNWHPMRSALGRLQNAGVRELYFALPSEYACKPADWGLVELELLADTLQSTLSETRDGRYCAEILLNYAKNLDAVAYADAIQMVLCLSTHAASLRPVGRLLCTQATPYGCDPVEWKAWTAWYLSSAALAQELLTHTLSSTAWQLMVDTLRRTGHANAAQKHIDVADGHPRLGPAAQALRQGGVHLMPLPRLSARHSKTTMEAH